MSMKEVNALSVEKLVTYVMGMCFCVLIVSMTTCTVHMNTYNPGEAKIRAAKNNADLEIANQKHEAEMERLKVVERLIQESNINPVAARCAVEGWDETPSVCKLAIHPETSKEEAQ